MITITMPEWFALLLVVCLIVQSCLSVFSLICEYFAKRSRDRIDRLVDQLYRDAGWKPKKTWDTSAVTHTAKKKRSSFGFPPPPKPPQKREVCR